MKIAICASMVFAEKMVQIKGQLEELGHTVFISQFAEGYLAKVEKEKEKLAIYDKNGTGNAEKAVIFSLLFCLFQLSIYRSFLFDIPKW
jgi:hypothetical protein